MKTIKIVLPILGGGIFVAGLLINKTNEIGYLVAFLGVLMFLIGCILNSNKSGKEKSKTHSTPAEQFYSIPSYEESGEILIFNSSYSNTSVRVWYNYNEDILKKIILYGVGTADFESETTQYHLPQNFLQEYSMDDLHYFITTHQIVDTDYQQFIEYNTLLIKKFVTPFLNREPLRIVEYELKQAEENKRRIEQMEKKRKEYGDFINETEHVFFYGFPDYGKRNVSIRKNKTTEELYRVIEIPTGRGCGFLNSEPEYIFEQAPCRITTEEFDIIKSKPQAEYWYENRLEQVQEGSEEYKLLVENEMPLKEAITVLLRFFDEKLLKQADDEYMPKIHDDIHRAAVNFVQLNVTENEVNDCILDYLKITELFKNKQLISFLPDKFYTVKSFWSAGTTVLVIDKQAADRLVQENDTEIFELCKKNEILLANYTNGIFFDCVSGDSFVIEHETDMGMADDAAFIDYYDFHRIEKE